MSDVPTFGDVDDQTVVAPIPFRLAYRTGNGPQEDEFNARGRIPYGWELEFWGADALDVPGQANALLTFLRRVVSDDCRDRFFAVLDDPIAEVSKATLQQIATYLLLRYNDLDPTRARSGGRQRSQGGRSRTSTGSSGSRSAKASTSRSSTRQKAPQ